MAVFLTHHGGIYLFLGHFLRLIPTKGSVKITDANGIAMESGLWRVRPSVRTRVGEGAGASVPNMERAASPQLQGCVATKGNSLCQETEPSWSSAAVYPVDSVLG